MADWFWLQNWSKNWWRGRKTQKKFSDWLKFHSGRVFSQLNTVKDWRSRWSMSPPLCCLLSRMWICINVSERVYLEKSCNNSYLNSSFIVLTVFWSGIAVKGCVGCLPAIMEVLKVDVWWRLRATGGLLDRAFAVEHLCVVYFDDIRLLFGRKYFFGMECRAICMVHRLRPWAKWDFIACNKQH
jgi:hypothetical protein